VVGVDNKTVAATRNEVRNFLTPATERKSSTGKIGEGQRYAVAPIRLHAEKRARAEAALRADPNRSNRTIAEDAQVSPDLVTAVRLAISPGSEAALSDPSTCDLDHLCMPIDVVGGTEPMIKRRGSIMPMIFDLLYREYCRARLAEMRKQLLLVSAESHEVPEANCDASRPDCAADQGSSRLGDSQREAGHRRLS